MIKAEVVADSKNEFGNRITTMVVTLPRIILAEFNTHRMLSKNSASSRAIPFKKMVKSVEENPFIPIAWQKDHKGMQGIEYITDPAEIRGCIDVWLNARDHAVEAAENLNTDEGGCVPVTKQLCNRLLEPFMYHTVIVTATEWENFFALRCPKYAVSNTFDIVEYRSKKDAISIGKASESLGSFNWFLANKGQAEIHMMALAEAMWDAYNESTPKLLKAGEWHIPFEEKIIEKFGLTQNFIDPKYSRPLSVKVSTMMSARTSYTVVGEDQKEWDDSKYIEGHDKLVSADPLHASPMEHCAEAMGQYLLGEKAPEAGKWSGNFKGFVQYRKMIPNENRV